MKVYNVKVEAQMQFHFPVVARDSVEAERIVHELCGVNGVDSEKGECFGRKEKAEIAKEGADFAPIHNDAKYFNTLPEFFTATG